MTTESLKVLRGIFEIESGAAVLAASVADSETPEAAEQLLRRTVPQIVTAERCLQIIDTTIAELQWQKRCTRP